MRAIALHHAIRGVLCAATLVALMFGGSALAGQVLEVRPSVEVPGGFEVGVRDAGGELPMLRVGETEIDVVGSTPTPSLRYQPLVIFVDTANIPQELLDRVKTNVESLVRAQFDGGSQLVIVADQVGNNFALSDPSLALKNLKDLMAMWTPVEVPPKMKYAPSNVASFLPMSLRGIAVPRSKPWAVVYSSLCVAEEEKPTDLSGFKGPVRFLTWDQGLSKACIGNRDKWLAASQGDNWEVLKLDDRESTDAVTKALSGLDVDDQHLVLSGYAYSGGNFNITVGFKGEENPWTGSYTEDDSVPDSWLEEFNQRRVKHSKALAVGGLAILIALLMTVALIKARTGAAEMVKWETVGEAEDLSQTMDPDAWNATIFQLTGAMPVIQDLVPSAAQLGPAKKAENARATRQQEGGELVQAAEAAKSTQIAPATDTPAEASDTAPPVAVGAPASTKKTGMTVAMPVLDDGTGYEADSPFEIGVLLSGKPVARKTKKFRKVFSIGRATDNRVVIQKDDTVHRYHVVVRPALQGKEWWLEVSPTATNRTNLNGKDLRAGGRYRLPSRFRLQLGEATEVRGRMSDNT